MDDSKWFIGCGFFMWLCVLVWLEGFVWRVLFILWLVVMELFSEFISLMKVGVEGIYVRFEIKYRVVCCCLKLMKW